MFLERMFLKFQKILQEFQKKTLKISKFQQ